MSTASSEQAQYHAIALQTEACLNEHILDPWIPTALDPEDGGFQQFFSHNWVVERSKVRSVVYQSRLTWVSARAARRYPGLYERFKDFSNHGIDCLSQMMWDHTYGGFYWSIEDDLTPAPWKHVYGISFAIYALAGNFAATQNESVLQLAIAAFHWLDQFAHDAENKGYYEALQLDGAILLSAEKVPSAEAFGLKPGHDAIGTLYGLKSMNTHIHLLESFSELYEVWPDSRLRERLIEVFEIVTTKVVHSEGYLHLYFQPDWTSVLTEDSYGHDIETAYLIVEAASVLGVLDDKIWALARKIVDHTLDVGWDVDNGGLYHEGHAHRGPTDAGQMEKGWWEQAESLNALLLMHERFGSESPRYWEAFVSQWNFIHTHQIDREFGGWFHAVSREGVAPVLARKSDAWTDPYHQSRALMNVTDALIRLASTGHSPS